jgi:hypothetical protein
MIRLLAAFGRLHRDRFRPVVDAFNDDHAHFQAVLADVVDFFSGLVGALDRVVQDASSPSFIPSKASLLPLAVPLAPCATVRPTK